MAGTYSLRSMSMKTDRTKLVYTDENGKEYNLGVFKNGADAERRMYAHKDQFKGWKHFGR